MDQLSVNHKKKDFYVAHADQTVFPQNTGSLIPCFTYSKNGDCCLGNPLYEKHEAEGDWRQLVETKLPRLKKLDGMWHAKYNYPYTIVYIAA